MFRRQQKMLQKLISMTKNLIIEQRRQNLLAESIPTYRQRTFSTPLVPHLSADRPRYNAAVQSQITGKASVEIPADVTMENLHECLNEMNSWTSRIELLGRRAAMQVKNHHKMSPSCKRELRYIRLY